MFLLLFSKKINNGKIIIAFGKWSIMEDGKTGIFDVSLVKKELISRMLEKVSSSLKERGYDPIKQIVGYLISGDPGYISNYKNARNEISEYDRTEILAIILESYLDKE